VTRRINYETWHLRTSNTKISIMNRTGTSKHTFNIRVATRAEVDIAVDWAKQEGWNPGLNDAECYYAADPNGFLVGTLDEIPIATISAIKYDDTFGFMGFYIVKPEFRGMGYGIQLWDAALSYLHGCNIGLDGVVEQQENYRKSGFDLAYRNIRYEGLRQNRATSDGRIMRLSEIPFEQLESYDRSFFPSQRTDFTKTWISQPECTALGIKAKGELAGYGVIRACASGHKIGPLFADNPELAESLFLALISSLKAGEVFYLDISELNPAAVALAEKHHMQLVFETARMYSGEKPALPLLRTFGVTSFEVG